MTRVIAILAGKGGTGKTTSAIALGAGLCHFGSDVVVVDTNLTTPNVGVHLGAPVVPINLHHVLQGKNKIKDSVYVHPKGLKIVPASIALSDLRNANVEKLGKVVGELCKMEPDFILLDGAAGLGKEALGAMESADELIVVTNPELPAITDALKTVSLANEMGKEVVGVVVTKTESFNYDVKIKNIEAMLERPVISVVPYDEAVRESLVMKDSVVFTHPNSKSAVAYKSLAASLLGVEYNEEVDVRKGFFGRVFKKVFW